MAMAAMATTVLREPAHSSSTEEVDIRIDMSLGDNPDDVRGGSSSSLLVGTTAATAPSSSYTPSPRKKRIRNKLSLSHCRRSSVTRKQQAPVQALTDTSRPAVSRDWSAAANDSTKNTTAMAVDESCASTDPVQLDADHRQRRPAHHESDLTTELHHGQHFSDTGHDRSGEEDRTETNNETTTTEGDKQCGRLEYPEESWSLYAHKCGSIPRFRAISASDGSAMETLEQKRGHFQRGIESATCDSSTDNESVFETRSPTNRFSQRKRFDRAPSSSDKRTKDQTAFETRKCYESLSLEKDESQNHFFGTQVDSDDSIADFVLPDCDDSSSSDDSEESDDDSCLEHSETMVPNSRGFVEDERKTNATNQQVSNRSFQKGTFMSKQQQKKKDYESDSSDDDDLDLSPLFRSNGVNKKRRVILDEEEDASHGSSLAGKTSGAGTSQDQRIKSPIVCVDLCNVDDSDSSDDDDYLIKLKNPVASPRVASRKADTEECPSPRSMRKAMAAAATSASSSYTMHYEGKRSLPRSPGFNHITRQVHRDGLGAMDPPFSADGSPRKDPVQRDFASRDKENDVLRGREMDRGACDEDIDEFSSDDDLNTSRISAKKRNKWSQDQSKDLNYGNSTQLPRRQACHTSPEPFREFAYGKPQSDPFVVQQDNDISNAFENEHATSVKQSCSPTKRAADHNGRISDFFRPKGSVASSSLPESSAPVSNTPWASGKTGKRRMLRDATNASFSSSFLPPPKIASKPAAASSTSRRITNESGTSQQMRGGNGNEVSTFFTSSSSTNIGSRANTDNGNRISSMSTTNGINSATYIRADNNKDGEVWFRRPAAQGFGSMRSFQDPSTRNDLLGGSGVGVDGYVMHQQNDEEDEVRVVASKKAPRKRATKKRASSSSSSAATVKKPRKKASKTAKKRGGRGSSYRKKKGGRKAARTGGGAAAAGGNNNGDSWSSYSRRSASGRPRGGVVPYMSIAGADPELGNIGGANITFG